MLTTEISHAKTCINCTKAIGMCNLTCAFLVKPVVFDEEGCIYFSLRQSAHDTGHRRRNADKEFAGHSR